MTKTVVPILSPSAEWWAVEVYRWRGQPFYTPMLRLSPNGTWEEWEAYCSQWGYELVPYLHVVRHRDEVLLPGSGDLRGIRIVRACPNGHDPRLGKELIAS